MPTPLIGITTNRQPHVQGFPQFSLAEAYTKALSQAGAIPVLIPLGFSEDHLRDLTSRLDGILFSGGGDIAPERYRSESHPEVNNVDLDRDRVECLLVIEAIQRKLPFFGICRGIQVINVALGGTLYTHLPDQLPGSIHHPYIVGKPRDYLAHEVLMEKRGRLEKILGQSRVMVNSMHHQGVARLASDFQPLAQAADGLIEAIELIDYPFGIAVQWHPEWLTAHAPMRGLFRAFVEAACR